MTDFSLSHYIDLNNISARPGALCAAKRHFGGIMLLCYPWNTAVLPNLVAEGKSFFISFFKRERERERHKFLKWLSKAIILINWFRGVTKTGIAVVEHIRKCKYIKQTNYYMYCKTFWWVRVFRYPYCLSSFKTGLGLKSSTVEKPIFFTNRELYSII